MTISEEAQLVRRAQAGDQEAAGILWDRITPKLYGYLVNATRNSTLAEDLLQNTWLAALEALPQYRAQGIGFGAWLFAIARNECRQHWRRTKHELAFDPVEHDLSDDTHARSIDEQLIVDAALHSLSEDDREIIRLRYLADLPIVAIARILSINSIAVRVRLHRALRRARAALNTN